MVLALQKVYENQTTNLTYDSENRLVEVKLGSTTIAAFTYDGDGRGLCTPEPRCGERGNRVKGVVDVPLAALGDAPLCSANITTVYIGNYFEWTHSTSTMKKYYYAGAQRVATLAPAASAGVRTGSSTLNWRDILCQRLHSIDWKKSVADVTPFLERSNEVGLLTQENFEKILGRSIG